MARSKRPNPDEPTQICLAIDTRTYEVIKIFGNKDGYSLGTGSYGNQHNLPLEVEIKLIHNYLSGLTCMSIGFFNTQSVKSESKSASRRLAKSLNQFCFRSRSRNQQTGLLSPFGGE